MTEHPEHGPMGMAKAPPHSREAEQCLLGGVLTAGVDSVAGLLNEADFYAGRHRLIWRACIEIDNSGERVDVVSVGDWFARSGESEQIDNGGYLIMLANETPGPVNMRGWARTIRDKSILRELIGVAVEIGDLAWTARNAEEFLPDVQTRLLELSTPTAGNGPKTLREAAAKFLDTLSERADNETRMETGLTDVDAMTMGFLPTELIVLAARPGMGKTSAALQTALHNARSGWVYFWSGEMSDEELAGRVIAAGVDKARIRNPKDLDGEDRRRMTQGLTIWKDAKLLIDDQPGIHINQLCARCRFAHKRHGLGAVFVDYLQLLTGDTKDGRTNEIAAISRRLKGLAKSLKVPVIALSQLNRGVETRSDKRPTMADLRESGQIEQDADQIIFLYREAEYREDFDSPVSEWIQAKHRSGSKGRAYTIFRPDETRFVNADGSAIGEYLSMLKPDEPVRRGSKFQRMTGGAS